MTAPPPRRPWWKRKRWAAALALWSAVAYAVSSGPLLFCVECGWLPSTPWYAAFSPLIWGAKHLPATNSALWGYLYWWHRLALGPDA